MDMALWGLIRIGESTTRRLTDTNAGLSHGKRIPKPISAPQRPIHFRSPHHPRQATGSDLKSAPGAAFGHQMEKRCPPRIGHPPCGGFPCPVERTATFFSPAGEAVTEMAPAIFPRTSPDVVAATATGTNHQEDEKRRPHPHFHRPRARRSTTSVGRGAPIVRPHPTVCGDPRGRQYLSRTVRAIRDGAAQPGHRPRTVGHRLRI